MERSDKKHRMSRDNVSRVRMLLKKHLPWQPGFPLERSSRAIRWRSIGSDSICAGQTIELTSDTMRRAQVALTKLEYRFPVALLKVIPCVESWLARQKTVMTLLKRTVHQSEQLSSCDLLSSSSLPMRWVNQFHNLGRQHPRLMPLMEAMLWFEFTSRHPPTLKLGRWVGENAEKLEAITIRDHAHRLEAQIILCLFGRSFDRLFLRSIFEVLADPKLHETPADGYVGHVDRLATYVSQSLKEPNTTFDDVTPFETVGDRLLSLVRDLGMLSAERARRASSTIGRLLIGFPDLITALRGEFFHEHDRLRDMIRAVRRRQPSGNVTHLWRRRRNVDSSIRIDKKLQGLNSRYLEALPIAFQTSQIPKHARAWDRFLDAATESRCELRLKLFLQWNELFPTNGPRRRALYSILDKLSGILRRHGVPVALDQLWLESVHDEEGPEFIQQLVHHRDREEVITRVFDIIEEVICVRQQPFHDFLHRLIVKCAREIEDVRYAMEIVSSIGKRGLHCRANIHITLATTLTDNASLAAEFIMTMSDDWLLRDLVSDLLPSLKRGHLRTVVGHLLLDRDTSQLKRLSNWVSLAMRMQPSMSPEKLVDNDVTWMWQYPLALHSDLLRITSVRPDADKIAARLLGREFPNDSSLHDEIASLERVTQTAEGINTERLNRRLNSLRTRIGKQRELSSRKLKNLINKVRKRADSEVVNCWTTVAQKIVAEHVNRCYHVAETPPQFFTHPMNRIVHGTLLLHGEMRTLGMNLLIGECSGANRSFQGQLVTDRRNRDFLGGLNESGINLQPWVESQISVQAITAADEPYTVSISHDLMDVLLMGYHFDTCLAPGEMNFFSAIANAVDVNKQLVYGKTSSGRIVGRCLLALADNGAILTYRRYAHDDEDGFSDAVDQLVDRLCAAMKTQRSTIGSVSNLVSSSWYDDGTVGVEGESAESSEAILRKLVRSSRPELIAFNFIELCRNIGVPMRDFLGQLLSLREFDQQPELAHSIIDHFGFDELVSFSSRYRLAVMAHKIGRGELRDAITRSLRPNSIPTRLKRLQCTHSNQFLGIGSTKEVFEVLTELNPTLALRTIRLTRSPFVRMDWDERYEERRTALVAVHRRLGRQEFAAKLSHLYSTCENA